MSLRHLAQISSDSRNDLVQYFAMCGVWALSTYTACDIGCRYCVTYAQGRSTPRVQRDAVAPKLRAELTRVPRDAVIGVGSLIDGYPTTEGNYGVTRAALTELVEQQRRILIVTKGTMIRRDVDVLARGENLDVHISLCTFDDEVLRRLEPHAAGAQERVEAARALARAGINIALLVQPWIPGVTETDRFVSQVGDGLRVIFGPLNVQSPAVSRTELGRRFTQRELNEEYVAERRRVGSADGVIWQAPQWLGDALPAKRRRGVGTAASRVDLDLASGTEGVDLPPRNVATVRRFVAALNRGTQLELLLEFWSPYVRCHDAGNSRPDASSGFFRDVLFEAAAAFDGARYDVVAMEADGDLVRAQIRVSGHHVRPLLGHAPSSRDTEVVTHNVYRFDAQGLVVEFWQAPDFAAIDGATVVDRSDHADGYTRVL